jgi:hypothetical protein|tara:strand:- start:1287 stop:2441 length:1155 start_codon:yes stop_codon:yes gene_type:complete
MAVYKLFPIQDAALYSFYPFMNTGIDAIIEAGNLNVNYNPVPQVQRFVVQFDQDQITNIINTEVGVTKAFSSDLKCFISNAQGVVMKTDMHAYAVSGSWDNGSGTYLDSPLTTNGVSWVSRNFSGSGNWLTSGWDTYVTASWSGSNNQGGGNWFTGSNDPNNTNLTPYQTFNLRTEKDLKLNVTDIVNVWYSSSNSIGGYTNIANEGFIVKWEDAVEFSTADAIQPIMQFYSVDTNTIYPPVLEIKWDDQSFETGSLSEIDTTDVFVALDSNPGVFYSESINRFRLNVRPEYPIRTYQTASLFTTNNYLNSSSLYAVKDLDTNEFIINFDEEYTKISCDEIGNYFTIYMNGLEPERYYKILIQTTISGSTIVKDDQYYFKVVNG